METNFAAFLRSLKKSDLVWRYGLNLVPTFEYWTGGKAPLNPIETGILDSLNTNGIAITSIDELFGPNPSFVELDTEVRRILEDRREEIASLKESANDPAIGSKTFNLEILGSELTLDANSVFPRFALSGPLLRIANAYFRMSAKLRYYNVWQTFASNGAARESQLWHFDREDRLILKAFLYLDDVDEGAGPFTYAPGTHKKGNESRIDPEFFIEGGVRRTTDEQMQAVFPKDRWILGTGKKGTLILADTRGFHKGGEARTKDRLMFTCMYTSPASESKNLISFPEALDKTSLNHEQRKALGIG